jgi:hypothetical protein
VKLGWKPRRFMMSVGRVTIITFNRKFVSGPYAFARTETLRDTAFDDYQRIWLPFSLINGDGRWRRKSRGWRLGIAERVLRDLHHEDLIYFFRVPSGDVNRAAIDTRLRLSAKEADAVIASEGWRREPYGEGLDDVWMAATPEGRRVAEG